MRRKSAFTLIELLVVVAIIAILIAILLPSLNRAKDNARKTVCAANLKAQGLAVAMYAASFSDAVPFFPNGGPSYPQDQPVDFGNMLLAITQQQANALNGSDAQDTERKIFWCPSNFLGEASANQWSSNNTGNFTMRTMGYAYFNARQLPGTETGNWANLDQNLLPAPRVSPPMKWLTKWSANAFASQVEFAEDLMYTHAPTNFVPDLSNIVWTTTTAGDANYPNAADGTVMVDHRTTYAGAPSGANVLCCDGHAEWRPFAPGKMHWQKVVGPTTLYWFYPDP